MKRLLAPLAMILVLSTVGAGCSLLSSDDGEVEVLRAELASLREEVVGLSADIAALSVVPAAATTTAPAPEVTEPVVEEEPEVTPPESPVDEPVDEEAILTATYGWGPSDEAVALQQVLGIGADGWYGGGTRAAHVAELDARGLAHDGVPTAPTTTTVAPEESTTTTAAPVESTTTTTVAE